jgi:hypothetical protein
MHSYKNKEPFGLPLVHSSCEQSSVRQMRGMCCIQTGKGERPPKPQNSPKTVRVQLVLSKLLADYPVQATQLTPLARKPWAHRVPTQRRKCRSRCSCHLASRMMHGRKGYMHVKTACIERSCMHNAAEVLLVLLLVKHDFVQIGICFIFCFHLQWASHLLLSYY